MHMNEKIKENIIKDSKEQAYKMIRDRIFSGFYLPRQRLVEFSLSKDLGINRMIVRDTLKRLALEGLVVMQPYKGCTVKDVSLDDVYQTYQVEAVLEGFAASLAAERITRQELQELEGLIEESKKVDPQDVETWGHYNKEIHGLINRASRNGRLMSLIRDNVKLTNYWFIVLSTSGQIPQKNKEHSLILAALRKRCVEEVRSLVEKHIMDSAHDIGNRSKKMFPFLTS